MVSNLRQMVLRAFTGDDNARLQTHNQVWKLVMAKALQMGLSEADADQVATNVLNKLDEAITNGRVMDARRPNPYA
ncbi:MAG: hypothetical protein V3U26_04595, partial [Dehalococcoidia bacterium]